MIFQILFICIFVLLFIYGIIRPFSSIVSRLFLIFGSILGILSLIGTDYTQTVANYIGIGRATDLYLYLSLVTIFLFITYTVNKIDSINKKISILVKKVAIKEAHSKVKEQKDT
tara:strand:- start:1655 stop:1996 length:342 start_codon:yes stop_codon:yes gene_type:complete